MLLPALKNLVQNMPLFVKKKKSEEEQGQWHESSHSEVESSSMWAQLEKKLKKLLGLC